MAWFDLNGLDDLAGRLRLTPPELADARIDGAHALGQLGHDTERARFEVLLADREAWAGGLAEDLEARSLGMVLAEGSISTLAVDDDSHHRFNLGACHYAAGGIADQVESALGRVEDLLRTDGTKIGFFSIGDTEVTAGELEEIAEILLALDPPVLRALLQAMDDDLLRKWLDEADESDLDGDLQAELFEYLGTVAGSQLGRLVLLSDGETQDRLLAAIDEHSMEWVKSWVFRTVADGVDGGPALAVETFAMLTPDQRGRAMNSLDIRGRIGEFVTALVTVDVDHHTSAGYMGTTGYTTTTYRYDASALADLVALLPHDGYADAKAALFVEAVEALEERLADSSEVIDLELLGFAPSSHRFVDDSGTAALHALAVMLAADGPDIYDSLRLEYDSYGNTTTEFMRELFREPGARGSIHGEPLSHDGAILANDILASLMDGGLDPADRAEFFTRQDRAVGGGYDYVNAARLGWFMGTVSGGLDDLGTSSNDDWTAIGIVLGITGLVDPTKVTSVAKVAESTLTTIADEITDHNVEELRQEYRALELLMVESIVPQIGGRIFDGDATDEFLGTYDVIGGGVVGE